jgi:hypothetical protein
MKMNDEFEGHISGKYRYFAPDWILHSSIPDENYFKKLEISRFQSLHQLGKGC